MDFQIESSDVQMQTAAPLPAIQALTSQLEALALELGAREAALARRGAALSALEAQWAAGVSAAVGACAASHAAVIEEARARMRTRSRARGSRLVWVCVRRACRSTNGCLTASTAQRPRWPAHK